ncbi:hypothetical protein Hanom_Chr01g00085191 [Helianthus anomalus]
MIELCRSIINQIYDMGIDNGYITYINYIDHSYISRLITLIKKIKKTLPFLRKVHFLVH